ncbi:MAG TPA: hypothetical protein VE913_15775 [Longimicrobium sp.]|nr:hypothetical protein [Longimicrobium sp.]
MNPSNMKLRVLGPALLAAVWRGGQRQVSVFVICDSTMADKPNPERGWGRMLPSFLDSALTVRTFAVNGWSTRSFINEGRRNAVARSVRGAR